MNEFINININEQQQLLPTIKLPNHSPISPISMRKTSKGKPENICQLLNTVNTSTRTLSTAGIEFDMRISQNIPIRKISLAANMKINSTSPRDIEYPDDNIKNRSLSIGNMDIRQKKSSLLVPKLHKFSSQLRSPKFQNLPNPLLSLTPYTPPPMLSPHRSGSGLYCQILNKVDEFHPNASTSGSIKRVINNDELKRENCGNIFSINEENELGSRKNTQPKESLIETFSKSMRPTRKNGIFLSGQDVDDTNFAAELEALRKESTASTISTSSLNLNVDTINSYYRPKAIGSREEKRKEPKNKEDEKRKLSILSDTYYDFVPPESDATPHINLGKTFQARVRKWADREITVQERAMIPDRDEPIFDCKLVDHLATKTVAAYEALACSFCIPRSGRNKELALHILMENKGNIQASVMDLLRSDTLDWDQYPIVFNQKYTDTDSWSPEEIAAFQDAIYKSEKDFRQVAADLGNRTVKECIAFYYTWKKACPDDYRKLRNLRRKRQLLEQQLDYSSFISRNRITSENIIETSDDDISETESDATNPYMPNIDYSPINYKHENVEYESLTPPENERKRSTVHFAAPEIHKEESSSGDYHWMHSDPKINVEKSLDQRNLLSDMNLINKSPLKFNKIISRNILTKKGAQPAEDGFFHCRLCDKRFEKVKSLNAHMKSHAMKARAEAEAQQNQANNNNFSSPQKVQPTFQNSSTIVDVKRNQFDASHLKQAHDLLGPMPQINPASSSNSTRVIGNETHLNQTISFNRLNNYGQVPSQLPAGLNFVPPSAQQIPGFPRVSFDPESLPPELSASLNINNTFSRSLNS